MQSYVYLLAYTPFCKYFLVEKQYLTAPNAGQRNDSDDNNHGGSANSSDDEDDTSDCCQNDERLFQMFSFWLHII